MSKSDYVDHSDAMESRGRLTEVCDSFASALISCFVCSLLLLLFCLELDKNALDRFALPSFGSSRRGSLAFLMRSTCSHSDSGFIFLLAIPFPDLDADFLGASVTKSDFGIIDVAKEAPERHTGVSHFPSLLFFLFATIVSGCFAVRTRFLLIGIQEAGRVSCGKRRLERMRSNMHEPLHMPMKENRVLCGTKNLSRYRIQSDFVISIPPLCDVALSLLLSIANILSSSVFFSFDALNVFVFFPFRFSSSPALCILSRFFFSFFSFFFLSFSVPCSPSLFMFNSSAALLFALFLCLVESFCDWRAQASRGVQHHLLRSWNCKDNGIGGTNALHRTARGVTKESLSKEISKMERIVCSFSFLFYFLFGGISEWDQCDETRYAVLYEFSCFCFSFLSFSLSLFMIFGLFVCFDLKASHWCVGKGAFNGLSESRAAYAKPPKTAPPSRPRVRVKQFFHTLFHLFLFSCQLFSPCWLVLTFWFCFLLHLCFLGFFGFFSCSCSRSHLGSSLCASTHSLV